MIDVFYNDYFVDLAKRHPSLLHTDQKRHFWHLADADSLGDLKKVLTGTLLLPALVLHPFSDEPSMERDNFTQDIQGAFTILLPATASDPAGQRAARYAARKIGIELIAAMRKDKMPGGALANEKIRLGDRFPGNDEGLLFGQATGWTYEFGWLLPLPLPAPNW